MFSYSIYLFNIYLFKQMLHRFSIPIFFGCMSELGFSGGSFYLNGWLIEVVLHPSIRWDGTCAFKCVR